MWVVYLEGDARNHAQGWEVSRKEGMGGGEGRCGHGLPRWGLRETRRLHRPTGRAGDLSVESGGLLPGVLTL